ncbi:PIN domain-containing protein [Pseudonocardia benzenivorans]|jgi:PIN domain nuclease of toxin-antitoxin system|uniref:PilT protein domain protein n=2 Tax=Pseudonocardia TaxID=1847 RepID=F4CV38_PSEUX|nr:type II toxin-antitoxin system VapC family toxin [Pseudonocardia dioxanivorans]AEA28584.1 PilT protein domain protein [Pseudonocardia dioxanivorans CB1190]GJF03595.1 hypothetical protein PSD17_25550 [Pseudonocardia sp. D17]
MSEPPADAPADRMVLDASALLAWLRAEPGADVVEPHLAGAAISTVSWSEVGQKLAQHGVDAARTLHQVRVLGVIVEPFTLDDAATAAAFWEPGREAGLSLGDRCCLALAARLDRPALTADAAWTRIGDIAAFGVPIHLIR